MMLTDDLPDVQDLQFATSGTLDDIWMIEAYFSRLTPASVFVGTCNTKAEVYRLVANCLMSEGIVQINVLRNGEMEQRIKVDDREELKWEATFASPESQAALRKRAKQIRRDMAKGRIKPGGFDSLLEEEVQDATPD